MTRVPQCQCLAATEEALTEQGLMLSTVWVQVAGKAIEVAALETIKLNPKDRKVRARMILATYCPFCGLAYVEPEATP